MKNLYRIAAFAIFGLFIFINIYTLNDGHNWGDDFAQYIQHAINLVGHKPYASHISRDLWIVYPPGFPLLLSSVIYWFGVNFKLLKSLNVLLWALSALAAYGLALRWLDLFWAAMVTVWFLSSPFFFFFKQNVLSDIPFMCFVLLSLWTFMKFEEYQHKAQKGLSRTFLLLSIVCMSYSLLIRWAAISLFLSVILYFFFIKRDWRRSLGFILGAIVSLFLALQCGSSPTGYFDKTTVSQLQAWPLVCWNNLAYTFGIISGFFISNEKFFSHLGGPFSVIAGLLFLGMIGIFFYRFNTRKISFMGCFTFVYLIGTICWPVHAGPRFLLPIMVPVAIYLVKCIKPVPRLAVFILLFLILQNIFVIASDFKFNNDDIFQKDSLEMMQWVKLHIKPNENYMFSRPRALGLLTHRTGYSFWTSKDNSGSDWYKRIKPLHIKYLIANNNMDQFSQYNNVCLQIDGYKLYVMVVWTNNMYKIYKVVLDTHE
jgi:hypothetical protein